MFLADIRLHIGRRILDLRLANTEAEGRANRRIGRRVVVGITVSVHIAHVRGVVSRRGRQPPVTTSF